MKIELVPCKDYIDACDANWSGTYTAGYTDIRGTHIWIQPSSIIACRRSPDELYDDITEKDTYHAHNPDVYPKSDGMFRCEHLKDFIKDIKDGEQSLNKVITHNDAFSYFKNMPDTINSYIQQYPKCTILVDLPSITTVWILKDLSCIIAELESVLQTCIEGNVLFICV